MDKITSTYRSFDPLVYIVEIPSGVNPKHYTGDISVGIENMQIKLLSVPIADASIVGTGSFNLLKIGTFEDADVLDKISIMAFEIKDDVQKFCKIVQENFLVKDLLL